VTLKREDCWMTFSEALERYLEARETKADAPEDSNRWRRAKEDMDIAVEHLDALTAPAGAQS